MHETKLDEKPSKRPDEKPETQAVLDAMMVRKPWLLLVLKMNSDPVPIETGRFGKVSP